MAWKIVASPKALLKATQYAAESKFCSKKEKEKVNQDKIKLRNNFNGRFSHYRIDV